MTAHTDTPAVVGAEVYRTNGERIVRAKRVYLHLQTTQPACVTS
jgi:hypothetical protein